MSENVSCRNRRGSAAWLGSAIRAATRSCLPVCLTILSYSAVRAETPEGCLTGNWIAQAKRFVAGETGAPVPEVCIRFASTDRMTALALSAAPGRAHDESVAAVYVPGTREILLADDLDPVEPLTHSYLVHELVHAQQFAARKHLRVSCPGSLEGDAYNAQALYLSTRGARQDAFLLQVLGMLQSACEYDH
jgi:hypothetical protein